MVQRESTVSLDREERNEIAKTLEDVPVSEDCEDYVRSTRKIPLVSFFQKADGFVPITKKCYSCQGFKDCYWKVIGGLSFGKELKKKFG